MISARIPENEIERLAALRNYEILDSEPEQQFDRIARLAAIMLRTPIAAVCFIDERRQWFKSIHGLDIRETHRDVAFCAHAIHSDEVLVVADATADVRFCDNPLVAGWMGVRFYAGAPLRTKGGQRIGTLCVIDTETRGGISLIESNSLLDLANLVMDELDLCHNTRRLSQANNALSYSAEHDFLTGLPNRSLLEERLKEAVNEARANATPLSAIYCDLDRFKIVNDTFGHHAGDLLIKQVADRFRELAPSNSVYRVGDDEFAILLTDPGNAHSAQTLGGRIVEAFAAPFVVEGKNIVNTLSLGFAGFPEDAQDADTLLSRADLAMYAAKRGGRNRLAQFVAELGASASRCLQIETYLNQCLEDDLFQVYYQPQVRHDGTIIGVEALARLPAHPTLGPVSPDEFIPIAEESGLIFEIGRRVLSKACDQGALWQGDGHPIKVAVNVSALQLCHPSFPDTLRSALQSSGLHAGLLQVELTETALMMDPHNCAAAMSEIKALGVFMALDDFGSGYSSFRYLHQLPLDTLKIDMLFVKGLNSSPSTFPMLRAIVALGQNMDLNVIAEGVETEEQKEILERLGCKLFQGYLFAKPLLAQALTNLLRLEVAASSVMNRRLASTALSITNPHELAA